jgi:hypothetical protein
MDQFRQVEHLSVVRIETMKRATLSHRHRMYDLSRVPFEAKKRVDRNDKNWEMGFKS